MKRFFFLTCALVLAGAVQANSPGTALTAQQISDQAMAESKSLQIIERQTDGRVRMTAPMQAMEALIGPEGMELRSVDAGGEAAFGWRLGAIGRAGRLHALENMGEVVIEGERVAVLRSQAIEEFSASADGIRQDFVIPEPPSAGGGGLVLELEANAAELENLPDNDHAILLRMADGRELHYHALRVTDATGQELPARMHAQTETRLRITVDDASAHYPVRVDPTFSDADWTAIAQATFNAVVRTAVFGSGDLYVGGDFSTPANNLARWDGSTWRALGDGVNNAVYALAWDAKNGHLYAGGDFTSAGGNDVNRIGRWDVSAATWSPVGDGVDDAVSALAWDAANDHLYVGGRFTSAGGKAANHIARWDAAVGWSSLGDGMNDLVSDLIWDAEGGHLYAGGVFTIAGGANANYIARWDAGIATWSPIGGGMNGGVNGAVYALAWDAENDHLYAGGVFTFADGIAIDNIARWDGSWSPLGSGVDGSVRALAFDLSSGYLYAGGRFDTAGGTSANRIARWDIGVSKWTSLGDGVSADVTPYVSALAMDTNSGYIYAGGFFTSAGSTNASRIARWDGTDWSALGNVMGGTVQAMVLDETNGFLYAGGSFASIGSDFITRIARWDGSAWSALGTGVNGTVNALAWDEVNEHLYAGGNFSSAGGKSANSIARWDGKDWSALDDGVDIAVYALARDASNGHLYVGGFLTSAGGEPVDNIARWDGSDWSALGVGVDGWVHALAWDAENGQLYAGGTFSSAGGNPSSNIARWDGAIWTPLDGGTNNSVNAMAFDPNSGVLYVGGGFTAVGGGSANRIATWMIGTEEWFPGFGDGMDGSVTSLAWDAEHQRLFAGGNFTTADGISANRIALWDGTWSALGSGINGSVHALAWDAGNNHLYAGGSFSSAGGHPARIARAKIRRPQDPPISVFATPDGIAYGQTSTLSIGGGSGMGAVSFELADGAEYCSLNADTLTGTGIGTCTITAIKTRDDDYYASVDTVNVTVTRATGTLVFDNLTFTYDGDTHEVTAYIDEEPDAICGINESLIGPDAGDYAITASCNGTNYVASGSAIATITKAEQAPLIVTASPALILAGTSSLLSVSGGSGEGIVNLKLSDGAEYCELVAGTLTGLDIGTCTVTATKAGDANYHSTSDNVNVTVVLDGVFSDRFE